LFWYLILIISILFGFSYSLIYLFQKSYIEKIDTKLNAVVLDVKDDFKEKKTRTATTR